MGALVLVFRNLTVTPDDPVTTWGVEGVLTAIERGGLVHHRAIVASMLADPHGEFAADVEQAAALTEHPLGQRITALLHEARGGAEAEVARRIRDAIALSGTSLRECARRLGTSASRLSTYASGKVQPSAAFLIRAESTLRDRQALRA